MSALGDSLWRQFGGDVPATPQNVARDAIQRYGSGRAAGRALGVDEKTIRRWKSGETRSSDNVTRLAQEARKGKADSRTGPIDVAFKHARRERKASFGAGGRQSLTPGTEGRMRDAYVAGDRERMAAEFAAGVRDHFYGPLIREAYLYDLAGMEGDAGETSDAVAVLLA